MTEREKMISGELYDPTDKELEQFLMSHWQLPCTHFYLKNVIAEKEKMEAFIILNRRNQLL